MDMTDEQIQEVLQRYIRQKEYRRVYYGNKYKNDENYRVYVRDYNKERYENKKWGDNMIKHGDSNICDHIRAKSLHKYYLKNNRLDDFKNKYPNEFLLI